MQSGLVAVNAPVEGEREQRFRLKPKNRVAIAARRESARDRKSRREGDPGDPPPDGAGGNGRVGGSGDAVQWCAAGMIGMRGKARLTEAQLRRANKLIDQLEALLTDAKGDSPADPLYALTVVLTPAREAGNAEVRNQEKD